MQGNSQGKKPCKADTFEYSRIVDKGCKESVKRHRLGRGAREDRLLGAKRILGMVEAQQTRVACCGSQEPGSLPLDLEACGVFLLNPVCLLPLMSWPRHKADTLCVRDLLESELQVFLEGE